MISCPYLNDGGVMFFVNQVVLHCCSSKEEEPSANGVRGKFTAPPFIGKCKDADELDVEKFIDMVYQSKVDMINKLNSGELCHCSGCSELVDKNWTPVTRDNFKVKRLAIAPSEVCNASCSYCGQDHANKATYDVYGIINKLIDAKYLDVENVDWLVWGGGEPTIMANFDELYALFMLTKENILHTSAIRYSQTVADSIAKSDSLQILTSLDAGTQKTFQKIKKVDQFNTVIKNIKQYYDKAIKNLISV